MGVFFVSFLFRAFFSLFLPYFAEHMEPGDGGQGAQQRFKRGRRGKGEGRSAWGRPDSSPLGRPVVAYFLCEDTHTHLHTHAHTCTHMYTYAQLGAAKMPAETRRGQGDRMEKDKDDDGAIEKNASGPTYPLSSLFALFPLFRVSIASVGGTKRERNVSKQRKEARGAELTVEGRS